MAEDKFSKFKKRYKEGKIPTMAMPPIVPGPGGVARSVAATVAQPLLRYLKNAAEGGTKTPSKGRSGTFTDRLEGTRARPRTEKESNKFGPLVKRQENMPAKQGSRAIVKREENMPAVVREGKKDLQKYDPGKRSLAAQGTRTFGDKGQAGRVVGLSNKGKLALGAGGAGAAAAGYAGYKKAGSASADEPRANVGMRRKGNAFAKSGPVAAAKEMYKGAPRQIAAVKAEIDERGKSKSKSNSVGGTKNGPFKSDFAKKSLQGRNPTKAAGDKSILAGKAKPSAGGGASSPMSAFERQKVRQYEKEGYGGRSMTSAQAKARVQKERGFKFKDLFKSK